MDNKKKAESYLQESIDRFNLIKKRSDKESIIVLSEAPILKSIDDLLEAKTVLKRVRRSNNSIYIEKLHLTKNILFTGTMKKGCIPHGFGMLHFPDSKLKIIAEFYKEKIILILYMKIYENSIYFGTFDKTTIIGPILSYLTLPSIKDP